MGTFLFKHSTPLTERDKASIPILKERLRLFCEVADLDFPHTTYLTDFNVLRWLKAFDYHLDTIVPKLATHISYRRSMGLDGDISFFHIDPVLAAYFGFECNTATALSNDNESRCENLVQIVCLGHCDSYGLKRSVSHTRLMFSGAYFTEIFLRKIMAKEAVSGHFSPGITFVLDCEGLKFDNATSIFSGPLKALTLFLQAHYVEIVKQILVVNGGKFVTTALCLLKTFLCNKTLSKIKVLGRDWRHEILMYADPSELPTTYGGCVSISSSANVGDAKYSGRVLVPKKIPSSYYYRPLINEPPELILEKKRIPASGTIIEKCVVRTSSSCLQWYIETDGECEFGIFYSTYENGKTDLPSLLKKAKMASVDEPIMIYPKLTIRADFVPECGLLECKKIGYYYVEFTNTCALIARTVKFFIKVMDTPLGLRKVEKEEDMSRL